MPALVGFVPTVVSVLFGGGDVLAEVLIALAGIYVIYKSLRGPCRRRRHHPHGAFPLPQVSSRGTRPLTGSWAAAGRRPHRTAVPWEIYDAYSAARKAAEGTATAVEVDLRTVRALQRWERFWLVVVCLAPAAAGAAVYAYRLAFPNVDRFLTNLNIALFVASASVRPFRHVFGTAREHVAHVYATLAFPRDELDELLVRVDDLERRLGQLQTRTATHQEVEHVQDAVKPMLSQVLQAVHDMEDRTAQLTRQADNRIGLVERSLGLVPVADGSSALARIQWALVGVGRGIVAAFLSPIVLPVQLVMTTWDVLAKPFRRSGRIDAGAGGQRPRLLRPEPASPYTPTLAARHRAANLSSGDMRRVTHGGSDGALPPLE